MKSCWPSTPLGEMCSSVQYGYTASADEEPTGPKFLRIMDMMRSPIDWEAVPYCEISAQDESKFLLQSGDIVVARTGQGSIGSARFVASPPRSVFASYLVRFNVATDHCARYVGYVVESPDYERHVRANAGGASRPSASAPVLASYPVPTPPLRAQRKIAAVLAAYDELIENNLRRIEILEEMAQAVYREWFVNFRFPGHEDVALVDSPLGPIPEGWEVSVVNDAFEILGGATPSTKRPEYWDRGTINWYTPSDLTAHGHMFIETSGRQITAEGLGGCSATLFPAGSVMMTSRATLGVVAINLEPACTNQGFITCLPNNRVPAPLIFFWIKSNFPLIESLASGATFKEITKRAFRQIDFLIPSGEVGRAFSETAEPMLSLVANLIRQNANLRTTRDLLLPKLVSGEIDISDLEIETEWLAS